MNSHHLHVINPVYTHRNSSRTWSCPQLRYLTDPKGRCSMTDDRIESRSFNVRALLRGLDSPYQTGEPDAGPGLTRGLTSKESFALRESNLSGRLLSELLRRSTDDG